VFHSPQAGHLPSHFALSFPQEVQNHTVLTFAIVIITERFDKLSMQI
jgi:hypothetical protein